MLVWEPEHPQRVKQKLSKEERGGCGSFLEMVLKILGCACQPRRFLFIYPRNTVTQSLVFHPPLVSSVHQLNAKVFRKKK